MASPPRPLLEPSSRAALRTWLAENHATSLGVELAVGKKGNTVTALTYDDAVEEGLAFGWIDSVAHRLDADRYTVRFTPRRRGSIWAKSNLARVARLTAAGLMTPAGMAVVEAAQAEFPRAGQPGDTGTDDRNARLRLEARYTAHVI